MMQLPSKIHYDKKLGEFWTIQEILLMMGTEIFQFGPGKAEKIGFKDVNLNYEVIVIMDFLKKGRPLQIKFPL